MSISSLWMTHFVWSQLLDHFLLLHILQEWGILARKAVSWELVSALPDHFLPFSQLASMNNTWWFGI